jgi:general L-amino acid transport system permease protein
MAEVRVAGDLKPPEPPPEASQPGAVVWLRKNLFSNVGNSILTVVMLVVVVAVVRAALGFVFDESRLWDVIPRNSANYAIEAYPRANIARAWLSLDIVAALVGMSLAVWRPSGRLAPAKLIAGLRAIGTVLIVVGILSPSSFGSRMLVLVMGVVLVAAAMIAARMVGDSALNETVPVLILVAGSATALLIVVWLLPIASTTQVPITLAVGVAAAAYAIGRGLIRAVPERTLRSVLAVLWLLSLPVIYLHVQRNPELKWSTITGDWLPWIAIIAIAGLGLVATVSRSDRERAGVINAAIVVVAIGLWFFSVPMVARMLVILLVMVSLATPTFGSSQVGRRNILVVWLAGVVLVTYLFAVGAAETGLETRNEYFGGLNLTLMLAVGSLLLSFPIGIMLALGRTSSMPIFRLLSTGYIETIRGVPLITVLFTARLAILNFLPEELEVDGNVLVLIGMTAFSAAYLAENVRGGLQSIPKGQYEAAKALGMSTAQMTMLITLPQALRAVIPAIVGQVIALFKDTSLVAIIGLADFFRVVRDIVPNQPTSLGSILENLIFAAIVYWVFTFSFSRASQRIERRLGVGTR